MAQLTVLFGISGSISAYKIPDLIRQLKKLEYSIIPILTSSACDFVTPTSIAVVSEHTPYCDDMPLSASIHHLSITKEADIMVVCPATANSIAKFSHGIADDMLSQAFLSFTGPKLIVPAMHTEMFQNPITQDNIQRLRDMGVHILGPSQGDLACGDTGMGRLISPDIIIKKIQSLSLPHLSLNGKSILVTAGGTSEYIDPVRVLTNRSSGQLGHHLALSAAFSGADVTLLSTTPFPYDMDTIRVVETPTVSALKEAVLAHSKDCDALYMAAAVSDYTVNDASATKLNRSSDVTLSLTGTDDILALACKEKTTDQCFVGFCLDDEQTLEASAQRKLASKGVDFMVSNSIDNIGASHRSFTVYSQNKPPQHIESVPLLTASHHLLQLAAS